MSLLNRYVSKTAKGPVLWLGVTATKNLMKEVEALEDVVEGVKKEDADGEKWDECLLGPSVTQTILPKSKKK